MLHTDYWACTPNAVVSFYFITYSFTLSVSGRKSRVMFPSIEAMIETSKRKNWFHSLIFKQVYKNIEPQNHQKLRKKDKSGLKMVPQLEIKGKFNKKTMQK